MSNWNRVFKPIVVLCVICIVITGALAATNAATGDWGARIDALPAEIPTADVTYYARWTADDARIVLHVNADDVTPVAPIVGWTGKPIDEADRQIPSVAREGYAFGGWFRDAALSDGPVTEFDAAFAKGTTEYWAKWDAKTVTFTFHAMGGTAVGDVTHAVGEQLAATSMPVTTRAGYTFAGWFGDKALSGEAVGSLPAVWPAEAREFWAKWTADPATITFATGIEGVSVEAWTGVTDGTLPAAWPAAPTDPSGELEFVGWTIDGKQVAETPAAQFEGGFPAGTTQVSATWKKAGQITITFHTNGGSAVDSIFGDPGAGVPNRTMPETTRAGYTFAGWFDNEACEGDAVTMLDTTYPAVDTDYWAKWTANTYPIEFDMDDANAVGGVTNAEAWADAKFDVTFGDEAGLPTLQTAEGAAMDAPKREGYMFAGWYATSVVPGEDGAEPVETEVPWYTAVTGNDGTVWTKAIEGAWSDISVVSGEGADAKVVLKAKWVVMINSKVPASIEFTIDPTTVPPTADAQSGRLVSKTPVPLKLEQVNIEKDATGFDDVFESSQIDLDVKLNMTATADGKPIILGIPTNDTVVLDETQLMQFVIPAWDGGVDPAELNVSYKITMGENVQLHQLANATIGRVYYVIGLAE